MDVFQNVKQILWREVARELADDFKIFSKKIIGRKFTLMEVKFWLRYLATVEFENVFFSIRPQ